MENKTNTMKKEELLKLYNDGLEQNINHPILLENRKLKDLIKLLCADAFELGWNICLVATKQASKKEIDDITKDMVEKMKKNI